MNEAQAWSVGIISAPRTPTTLSRCITGVHAAGFPTPHVFAEPGCRKPQMEEPFAWHQRGAVHGAWPNWLAGLMQLSQLSPEASYYLMLEDDALLFDAGGAIRHYVHESLPAAPNSGFCSLYCAEAFCPQDQGWIRCNLGYYFIGALALVFTRALLEGILTSRTLLNHRRKGGADEGSKLTDAVLGQWALDHDLNVYVHHPSLVEHISHDSTVGNADQPAHLRQARAFIGGDSNIAKRWRARLLKKGR